MKRSILIVDDDAWIRTSLTDALARSGNEVRAAEDAEAALAALAESPADLVLTDVRMPGMDGLALLRFLRERMPDVAVVLMTAYDDLPTVSTAMREGAADFLAKPLDLHQLRGVVNRVFEDRRARAAAARAAPTEAWIPLPPRNRPRRRPPRVSSILGLRATGFVPRQQTGTG